MTIRLTEANSEPKWDPDAFRKIAAETLSIVRYRQNTIGYSLAFDVRFAVFDSHPSATQALSLCLHQSSGRGQPERMLRGQGLRRSIQSVESGDCRSWTREARCARMHIELSRSMRHGRDGFSRTRPLFLRARYGCRRSGDS